MFQVLLLNMNTIEIPIIILIMAEEILIIIVITRIHMVASLNQKVLQCTTVAEIIMPIQLLHLTKEVQQC